MENETNVLLDKAITLTQSQDYQQAYNIFQKLSNQLNDNYKAYWCYGICAYYLHQLVQAQQLLEHALTLNNQEPQIWNQLGVVLSKQNNNIVKEFSCFKKAARLAPNANGAYVNCAQTLIKAKKFKLAYKILDAINKATPDLTDVIINFAYLNGILGRFDDAYGLYKNIIEKRPNDIKAKANAAFNYLRKGEFDKGWEFHELRFELPALTGFKKFFKQPKWQGESLNAKTLLILCEQGFGDVIQFVRYIPLINKGSGKIILAAQKPLITLLKTLKNVDEIIELNNIDVKHDYHIPLLSLPKLFNANFDNIPENIPYLKIDPQKQVHWKNFFEKYNNSLKVGINWFGNPRHKSDKLRSINPKYFHRLSQATNLQLFSLQFENVAETCKKFNFIPLGQYFKDFSDTAACIACMDLIITVDTALAHLSGAFNIPIWNLLYTNSDWRWFIERTDSPWYPSMHLFRQTKPSDWNDVFDQVTLALKTTIKGAGFNG